MYLIFILAIVLMWYVTTQSSKATDITKAEFVTALEAGEVKAVKIVQNREVPTGRLTILMHDDSTRTMYASAAVMARTTGTCVSTPLST